MGAWTRCGRTCNVFASVLEALKHLETYPVQVLPDLFGRFELRPILNLPIVGLFVLVLSSLFTSGV